MKKKKCTWPPMAMLQIWGSSAMIGTVGMDPPILHFCESESNFTIFNASYSVTVKCHSLISEQLPRVCYL